MSPMTLDPITRNAVPWNAVKIRKTKKDARLGAKAVPMEKPKKSTALVTETWKCEVSEAATDISHNSQA